MLVKNPIISRIIIGLFLIVLTCWLPASGAENVYVTPVTTPFITVDPIGNHTVGDVFFINGTTNIPVSEKLSVTVSLRTFQPSRQSFLTATVPILQGKNGVNSWSCNITPSTLRTIFKPYTYTFMAGVSSSMIYNVSNYSQSFDI
jgi:hypothetical protein